MQFYSHSLIKTAIPSLQYSLTQNVRFKFVITSPRKWYLSLSSSTGLHTRTYKLYRAESISSFFPALKPEEHYCGDSTTCSSCKEVCSPSKCYSWLPETHHS